LYYDIANDKVIDPTGRGLADIQNKVIRFNHKDVVLNDRLRILRAYRFAKKFGFTIEDRSLTLCRNEFDAMVKEISPTRMLKEIEKLCL
jgi:tRNA nucleotidyltransferase/poly(A) polymerase